MAQVAFPMHDQGVIKSHIEFAGGFSGFSVWHQGVMRNLTELDCISGLSFDLWPWLLDHGLGLPRVGQAVYLSNIIDDRFAYCLGGFIVRLVAEP